nr:helix-turn-helix transcriptional regulator [Faecalibacterium sp. BCRC 81149]
MPNNVDGSSKTIHEYLVDSRLQTARLLLLTTEKSVSDIAAELGFASASHLGSLFKQQEGLTPRQYRLQQRQLGK